MIVYLNGDYLELEQARISPEDRGFMFSDGIYEVVRYYYGKPLAMQMHADRLQAGLKALRIQLDPSIDLPAISDELMRRNGIDEGLAYWQVTRGDGPRDFLFPDPNIVKPTVFATPYRAGPLDLTCPPHELSAVTLTDDRWRKCEIKAISLLPNVLAAQDAKDAGAQCAILVRDGVVTESTSRSILIVTNNTIQTYPLDGTILDSITRRIVIDIAGQQSIQVKEEPFTKKDLMDADEVIAVGSNTEVAAVTSVNQMPITDGHAGPVTAMLYGHYRDYVVASCRG